VKIAVRKRGIAVAADEHIAVNLYRIAQEAITNAIKYGPARQISVSINAQPAYVTVSVKNDGRPSGPPITAKGWVWVPCATGPI